MKFVTSLVILMMSVSVFAEPLISLSGSVLSGFSMFDQYQGRSFNGQFDTAANLLVDVEISKYVSAQMEMNMGGYKNMMGFDNGVDLNGILVNIAPDEEMSVFGERYTRVFVGNNTVPFGQFSELKTNNASIPSAFILNDLGYAFLNKGNDVTSLSGTGAGFSMQVNGPQFLSPTSKHHVDFMVFNGIDNLDSNEDKGFGVTVRYKLPELPFKTVFGLSYLAANELKKNSEYTNVNVKSIMFDAKSTIADFNLGAYLSYVSFDDGNSETKDNATFVMAQLSRTVKQVTLAGRYSIFKPEYFKGDGGGSLKFPPGVGLATLSSGDAEVVRVQGSAILELEENVRLHNEVVFDTYGKNREGFDTVGFLSYLSIYFK